MSDFPEPGEAYGSLDPQLGGDLALPDQGGIAPMLGGEFLHTQSLSFLMAQLQSQRTSHVRRAQIGGWLAEKGDDRPGVGLDAGGRPDIAWCATPAGSVRVADLREPLPVSRFWIAQYPVTWLQYRVFLESPTGHIDPQWWEGLPRRDEHPRELTLADNHPVQEVSWFDAVAYTRWLSALLGYTVRLPAEAEWQMAAGGGDPANVYPWGPYWERSYANTRESRLRSAVAVGMYPQNISPVGAYDMAGNVLEWCQSTYEDPSRCDDYGPGYRTYRGGSWFLIAPMARVTWRSGNDPALRYNSVGLRLAADRVPQDEH